MIIEMNIRKLQVYRLSLCKIVMWNERKRVKNTYSYLNKRVLYKKKEKKSQNVNVRWIGGLRGAVKWRKNSKKVKDK